MLFPSITTTPPPYGARVLVRTSLNLPLEGDSVRSSFRLKESLRTIQFLQEKGARVTLLSHLSDATASLAPVHALLNTFLPVSFVPHVVGEIPYTARGALNPGEVLLLENVRHDSREIGNDPLFAEELAAQTDLFVFDDFSVAHRAHASVTGLIGLLPSFAGIRFYEEMTAILRLTERLLHPAVAVLGGAKCSTKIPLALSLAKQFDTVFIGGVLANTLLQHRGCSVGKSKTEPVSLPDDFFSHSSIILPVDVLVTTDNFLSRQSVLVSEIPDDAVIIDIGEKTTEAICQRFTDAKTIFVNGPTGWYEKGVFDVLLNLSEKSRHSDAYTFVGGGDSVAVLEQHAKLADWLFVSTGGGSLLHYLVHATLPVLEAFEKTKR